MSTHTAVWLAGLGLVVLLSISAPIALADGDKKPTTAPAPDPSFSPTAVAKIVVHALGNNDADDAGIKTTWKFASPDNQQATGPIENFIPMVKSPAYQPLLNPKSSEVRELAINGNHATELVVVTDAKGEKAYYIFELSKQTDGAMKDCWMTDGVMRVEPKDPPPPAKLKLPEGQSPV